VKISNKIFDGVEHEFQGNHGQQSKAAEHLNGVVTLLPTPTLKYSVAQLTKMDLVSVWTPVGVLSLGGLQLL